MGEEKKAGLGRGRSQTEMQSQQASANTRGSSEARMALQRYPELEGEI